MMLVKATFLRRFILFKIWDLQLQWERICDPSGEISGRLKSMLHTGFSFVWRLAKGIWETLGILDGLRYSSS